MVLDFQNIPFAFGSGLNTSVTPTAIPVGQLLEFENGFFEKGGAISKRNGYTTLDKSILGTTDFINNAVATAIYNNSDLLVFDTNNVYSYIPSMEKWINRGSCTAVEVTNSTVFVDSSQQFNPDVAIDSNGILLYAWQTDDGGINYSMMDSVSLVQIATNKPMATIGMNPQCINYENYIATFFETDDGRIQLGIVAPSSPNTSNVYTLVSDNSLTFPNFSATTQDGYLYVAYNSDAGQVKINKYNNVFATVAIITVSPTLGINAAQAINLMALGDHKINVSFVSSSGVLRSYTYQNDVETNSAVVNASGITIEHLTGYQVNNIITLYADNLTEDRPIVYTQSIDVDNLTIDSYTEFARAVSLASKPFTYADRQYVMVAFDTPLQPTYFILNDVAEVVAKLVPGVAGGVRQGLTNVINVDDSYILAFEKLGAIVSQDGTFANSGISTSNLNFNTNYAHTMLNQSLYITGGILQQYDGNSVTEQGFNYFPEDINYLTSAAGNISNGTYSWQFTYEWTDNTGKVERSAPSPAVTLTLNQTTNSITFAIPTLTLTKKDNVRLVVYRTRNALTGDPLLYRVTNVINPTLNDPTVDYIPFTDTFNDTSIDANDILYCSPDTQGQLITLENLPAPNCNLIVSYKNRLFIAGTDNPNQLSYSKTVVTGEAIAFNDLFTLNMDPKGGPISALAILDSNIIIFKESTMYLLSGLGPTNTGAQNDFQDPQMIASDIGCIEPNSIVLVSSLGLFFKSTKGIWLLNRTLQTEWIGSSVDNFSSQVIVSADQVPGTNQVRFTCSDGPALVYDYYWKQWGTYTNHIAIDAGIWNSNYYFIRSNGTINLETPNHYIDDTTPINIKITTGWLSFAGIENYQKVNSFMILGDYIGPHKLNVSTAYDGASFTFQRTIDTTTIFDINVFGQQNPYGQNSPFGGTFADENFRVIMSQRCSRIMIKIEEVDVGSPSAAVTLIGLNIKVGQKRGLTKVPANQQF